jgi:hypothetical protein
LKKLKINGVDTNPLSLQFSKFRKKPVVVNAIRINVSFEVETLEGTMLGKPGDYLIKGVNGELYPCKPDIFDKTYEHLRESE